MARTGAVWGIDIGQCALKALRCRAHSDGYKIIADAFDCVEYPKILSQAGANPAELIDDALKQFLSRNSVRGDRVAISVSGQSGLVRFIKLPPVEAKKIPDIVRYEARQQIPFDLNDVIWDYQRMGGGAEEEGFALETEVGLFAMKRDAVFRSLEPFEKAGIDVDFVQLMPLTLYNYLLFDRLTNLPSLDEYDPEDPPESTVILSLGTDATDLVVTNGFRVWQRNIPIGGNHFTRALTKGLKLTFAKAEHLKRNAAAAEDPKAVFQAMRPVFGDLLTELQRSIGYFSNIERAAKIGRIVTLGNAMKLPGLRRYLQQSLGYEVLRTEKFRGLEGPDVVDAKAFKDNVLSFGVCYGLALQGLGRSGVITNLLPREIVHDRLVREKQPWAVAAVSVVLMACSISFAAHSRALSGMAEGLWSDAVSQADATAREGNGYETAYGQSETKFTTRDQIGQTLVENVDNRILWLEMLRAVNECLPKDEPGNRPEEIADRNELHITSLDCRRFEDLAEWFSGVKDLYRPPKPEEVPATEGEQDAATVAAEDEAGPSGPGWVVALEGYHYHNFDDPRGDQESTYVRETLVKNLHSMEVTLPTADRKGQETVSMQQLGISHPVLLDPRRAEAVPVDDPTAPADPSTNTKKQLTLKRCDFVVQLCWRQTPPSVRAAEEEAAGGQPAE